MKDDTFENMDRAKAEQRFALLTRQSDLMKEQKQMTLCTRLFNKEARRQFKSNKNELSAIKRQLLMPTFSFTKLDGAF